MANYWIAVELRHPNLIKVDTLIVTPIVTHLVTPGHTPISHLVTPGTPLITDTHLVTLLVTYCH
eukprot:258985-Amorphochlora_amoeboformis.AAC.1